MQHRNDDDLRIDQLHSVVRHLLETHEQIHRTQARLQEMTEHCAAIIERWTHLDEQHARALAELEESARIAREAEQHRSESAENAAEGMIGSITHLVEAFERVENRLSTREQELARVTRQLQGGPAPAGQESAWPLDNVLQLHQQLREQRTAERPAIGGSVATPIEQPRHQTEAEPARSEGWRLWTAAVVLLGAMLAGWYFVKVRDATTMAVLRAEAAEKQLAMVREESQQQLDAVREAAKNETSVIREAAAKAKATADILSAPDLLRFDLVGQSDLARARGQALVSRSRGLVFTASRLPSPPAGSIYEIWVLTSTTPVRVASVQPDEQGRVSYTMESIPEIAGRIVGLVVSRSIPGVNDLSAAEICLAKAPKVAA